MDGSIERKRRQLELNQHLGALLAKLRKEKHLKQEDIAECMGFRRSVVSKIENGHHSLDATEILDYANALGIPPLKLFEKICNTLEDYESSRTKGNH